MEHPTAFLEDGGPVELTSVGVSLSLWYGWQLVLGLAVPQSENSPLLSDRPTSPLEHNHTVMSQILFAMATSHDSPWTRY